MMANGRGAPQAMRDFGMDTITLAGPLEAKLEAMQEAGFRQVMLKANDLVGHPDGWKAAVKTVQASGLRGLPDSRSCATSRAWRATCTTTRWTSPSRCWRCARP